MPINHLDPVLTLSDQAIWGNEVGGGGSTTTGTSASTCRPDRATGTRSGIICQEETCWGTLAEDSSPAVAMESIGVDFKSETIRNQINSIESELIRSDRMRAPSQQGNQRPGGDILGELQPHGFWPLALKHALGGSVVTTGSSPYVHRLAGAVNLPDGLSVEKAFGFPSGASKILRYLGGKVNEFYVSVPNEGIVQARAGLLFKKEVVVTTPMDLVASYPANNEPFNSFQGEILMDLDRSGIRTPIASIKSIEFTISNGISADEFAIDGDSFRADLPEDQRLVNGKLVSFFTRDNFALYLAYRDNTSLSLELTLSRGAYSWHFTIPQFKVRGDPTPQTPGRGPLDLPMDFEAHRDETLGTDILCTITNADPRLATTT